MYPVAVLRQSRERAVMLSSLAASRIRKSRTFGVSILLLSAFVPLTKQREASRFRYISLDGDSRCDLLSCNGKVSETEREREGEGKGRKGNEEERKIEKQIQPYESAARLLYSKPRRTRIRVRKLEERINLNRGRDTKTGYALSSVGGV